MLMWSHYASSHEGFVVGFDSENHYFHRQRSNTDEFGYLRKVIYRDDKSLKPMIELEEDDIFLVKGTEWEYEEEWRVISPLQNADKVLNVSPYPVYLFSFPPSAVDSVILGSKINKENVNKILEILKSSSEFVHIKIKQSQINPLERKLEILDYPI